MGLLLMLNSLTYARIIGTGDWRIADEVMEVIHESSISP
jgi:hypothetical protein